MARRTGVARPDTGERARFEARLRAKRPVLTELLGALYPAHDVEALVDRVVEHTRQGWARRKPSLVELDVRRESDPQWYQRSDRVGYVAYADRYGGTLAGVADRLDHLADLDVSYFHLMYVLRAREGANDGGYAVVAYDDVEPCLGTRADLEALADRLRERDISLCLDLVLNHTAREHPWAVAARGGSDRHRAYYIAYPDRTMPDVWETTLPETFPHLAPGNFTWDPEMGANGAGAWVWTTFNTYQWDLNYANPDVFVEMLDVMIDLANLGVEVLRLDAIAFTWKRLGTNSQNQPEAHLLSQAYRAAMEIAAPAVLLKAEAIVGPGQLVPYLGAHRSLRDECHVAYHNQLMVQLWSSLAMQDARLATVSLESLPPTPPTTTWVTYLRCHDDIGWAIDDSIAARVGIDGPMHREYLAAFYRGDFPESFACGAAFGTNPEVRDERTCGTAASLAGIERGLVDGDPQAVDVAVRRLLLAYAVVYGFGGIPLLYMGDEIAMLNDSAFLHDPALADDVRWMHRPAMDWATIERVRSAGPPVCAADDPAAAVYHGMRRLGRLRLATPAVGAGGDTWMHDLEETAVLAWARRHPHHGRFYGLANVATHPVTVPSEVLRWAGLDQPIELLGMGVHPPTRIGPDTTIELAPLSVGWFVDARDTSLQPPVPT